MQSSIDKIALHPGHLSVSAEPCPALNDRVPGLATCSLLASDPHVTHRMLADDTGETLVEWPATAAEMARAFSNSPRRTDVDHAA